jgi:hypothetical protein
MEKVWITQDGVEIRADPTQCLRRVIVPYRPDSVKPPEVKTLHDAYFYHAEGVVKPVAEITLWYVRPHDQWIREERTAAVRFVPAPVRGGFRRILPRQHEWTETARRIGHDEAREELERHGLPISPECTPAQEETWMPASEARQWAKKKLGIEVSWPSMNRAKKKKKFEWRDSLELNHRYDVELESFLRWVRD